MVPELPNPLPLVPSLLLLLLSALLHLLLLTTHASSADTNAFTFNGFRGANLKMDGMAAVTPEGLLRLSDASKGKKSHAFYPTPIPFKKPPSSNSTVPSFSTTFAFAIRFTEISGHGIALLFSPSTDFATATGSQFLGVTNLSGNGNPRNHMLVVELDTIMNPELRDINDNHVGVDVNGLKPVATAPAGYYVGGTGLNSSLNLSSGDPMQVWVDYDGPGTRVNVTMAPLETPKPSLPLLSAAVDLSAVFLDDMWVGFSATTDPFQTEHYILGWSFNMSAGGEMLDVSKLPRLPPIARAPSGGNHNAIAISLPIAAFVAAAAATTAVVLVVRRRRKYSEIMEDWERQYGTHRFSYRVLFDATKGFKPTNLLGSGGFGGVYRGVLPSTGAEIAVKRVSHESRQGIKEFVAEIVTIGRVRHRNVVQLLGYCRRRGELLLVYDYMPQGSLDKALFTSSSSSCRAHPMMTWAQRFEVAKGVAAGLHYLHEEWEQVVIHRDIKPSNILLDADLNARLGDFGLSRLYDHGTDPQTTHIVGTMGYLAPELARTGKCSKSTDVFAFGVLLLELATGKRPIDLASPEEEEVVLVDRVLQAWRTGCILQAADARLAGEYAEKEMDLVLKLGLLCSHTLPEARPQMKHVLRFLNGDMPLPELTSSYLDIAALELLAVGGPNHISFDSYVVSIVSGSPISKGGR